MSCDPLYIVPIVKITSCGIILPGRSPSNIHSSDSAVPKLSGAEHPIPAFHHPISCLCFPRPVDALSAICSKQTNRASQVTSGWSSLPHLPETARTAIPQPSCPNRDKLFITHHLSIYAISCPIWETVAHKMLV